MRYHLSTMHHFGSLLGLAALVIGPIAAAANDIVIKELSREVTSAFHAPACPCRLLYFCAVVFPGSSSLSLIRNGTLTPRACPASTASAQPARHERLKHSNCAWVV